MPPIDQQVTFLYTRDLPATARFYEDMLGLRLVLDQRVCKIYHVTGTSYVGFCERATAQPEQNDIIFTLVTQDVDGWHADLSARGVAFEKAPSLNEKYNIYHCFLRDPNGYLIEIQRFNDPNWAK